MDERKKQIIQGYNEIYNKVNAVKLYINIFKTYNEKLKKEFARANLYMSDENYKDKLDQINTIDLI